MPPTAAASLAGASLALLTTLTALTALTALAVLTGCGTQHAAPAGRTVTPQPSGAAGAAGRPAASLTIDVLTAPGGAARHWTLQCGPSGGTLPGAASACAAIARARDPFGPVPRGTMCSMVYGGPQTATVVGRWDGKNVDASYSRTNSCQNSRWNTLAALFPAAVTPGPTASGGVQVNPGGPVLPAPSKPAGSPGGVQVNPGGPMSPGPGAGQVNPGGRMSPGPGGSGGMTG